MFLRGFVPISVLLVGILFAAVDASSSFPKEKTTSCGRVEMQQCWCLEENPCGNHKHRSRKVDTTNDIPIISKKNILTAKYIKSHIESGSPTVLDLSGKKLEGIDRKAFDHFPDLKSLDLSNNKLSKLPAFVFSKLANLERLSLSGNGLKTTRKLFAGLGNLKTLDVTRNSLNPVLEDNCFFGLTKSCEIHLTPKSVKKMATDTFGSEPLQESTSKASEDEFPNAKSIHKRSAPQWSSYAHKIRDFKVCIKDNVVQHLDEMTAFEKLKSGCQEVETRSGNIFLRDMGIIDFEKGWFRMQDENKVAHFISVLRLTGNNMSRVTEHVVNELPVYITWLDMSDNKIERLDRGTFKHDRIFSLELKNNLISEIEADTFTMPKLYQLFLQNNRLKDTKFFATLPASLNSIDLTDNKIEKISPDSFSSLKQLSYLNLDRNEITKLDGNSFRGMTHLGTLVLSDNKIRTIEPGTFDNRTFGVLALDDNEISTIEEGVFNDLVNVHRLNVGGNKLMKISRGTFDLPTVKRLSLSKNAITEIEKGATKSLRGLTELDLSSNPISKLENGALFGLDKKQKCHVLLEHSPVKIIEGGVFDDV